MGSRSAAQRHPPSLIYNLAGIALVVLLLAIGAAYVVDALGRASGSQAASDTGATVSQTMSGRELIIPASLFRYDQQVKPGFASQVDLRVHVQFEGQASAPVDVTLLPRSRARTSASLLDRVYLHKFGETAVGGIPGLIGKPMGETEGFAGETVWYDPISPNPFVAKCMAPIGDGAAQCVRTVYLDSGIAAVYTFDAALLQSWRQFDSEMERWLTMIGAW